MIIVKDSSRVLKCTVAALLLGASIAGAGASDVFIKDTRCRVLQYKIVQVGTAGALGGTAL